MNHSLLLPVLIPLFAAATIIALPARARQLQRAIHVIATLALLPVAVAQWRRAAAGDIVVYALGHWPAPFGIVLQLDRLTALMLALTAVLACCCTLATSAADAMSGRHFRSLFQFQLMGLNGAFLAGDLFNLFVFFELLLIASYALLLHGGDRLRVRNGLHYLVLNLAGSSFFLIALGVLYGVTGTLNMADAGVRIEQLAAGLVLIVALSRTGTRIFWAIPAAYGYAPPPSATQSATPGVTPSASRAKLAACALLIACVVAVTLGAGPLKQFLDAAATQLADRPAYVDAVLHARR
jgi:multicomponent K+:H+ antiporter subunit D